MYNSHSLPRRLGNEPGPIEHSAPRRDRRRLVPLEFAELTSSRRRNPLHPLGCLAPFLPIQMAFISGGGCCCLVAIRLMARPDDAHTRHLSPTTQRCHAMTWLPRDTKHSMRHASTCSMTSVDDVEWSGGAQGKEKIRTYMVRTKEFCAWSGSNELLSSNLSMLKIIIQILVYGHHSVHRSRLESLADVAPEKSRSDHWKGGARRRRHACHILEEKSS